MTAHVPPLSQALEDYKITPQTLWVGFLLYLRGQPEQEVRHAFGLSYEGPQGVSAILAREQDPEYLGCFSLASLEHLLATLRAQVSARSATLTDSLASFLRIKKDFVVIVRQGDQEFMDTVKAFTLESAMRRAREQYPEAIIGFGGELGDLVSLVDEMRRVCQEQDFMKVDVDYRHQLSGWSVRKLLVAKRNPEMAPGIEAFTYHNA